MSHHALESNTPPLTETLIEVATPCEFPQEPLFGFRAKSLDEVRTWAQRTGASQVWVYRHKFRHEMFTAVRMVNDASHRVERASAELAAQAEAAR